MIPPAPATRHRSAAFTLAEILVGLTLTSVLLVAALTGVVALQKSYAATEGYGTGLADQMRLLDYLAQDLRRACASTGGSPWTVDSDKQGLKITVPDYYRFNSSDAQHLFPVANDPIYDPATGSVYYSSAVSGGLVSMTSPPTITYKTIAYRYTDGAITRTDPWQPWVSDGKGGYKDPGAVVIATSMEGFPELTVDNSTDTSGGVLRYKIAFYSTFQPLAVRGGPGTGVITLHNVTFVRSKNLAQ